MNARAIVLLLLALPLLAACTELEPRGGAEKPDGCAAIEQDHMRGPNRLYRYKSGGEFGQGAPASVRSKTGSASISYLDVTTATRKVDGGFRFAGVLAVVGPVVFIIGLAVFLLALPSIKLRSARGGLLIAAAVAAAGAGIGWLGGSPFILDNASSTPLRVVLDGETIQLPALSHVEVRLGGGDHVAEAFSGETRLEHVDFHPDGDASDAAVRALFGNGRFIYNVCGMNGYALKTAHYGR